MLFYIIYSTMKVIMYGRCLCAPRLAGRWRGQRSRQHSGEEENLLAGS